MTKDSNMSKMRYLTRRRGGGLALRVSKPHQLCADGKKKIVVRGLGTKNIDKAQELKWKALAELHAEWDLERPQGRTWDEELEQAQEAAKDFDKDVESNALFYHLDGIEAKYGPEAAQQWGDIAAGAVPISLASAQWSEHHKDQLSSGTFDGDKKEHLAFYKWSKDIPVQQVDAALAGKYVREVLLKQLTPKGSLPAPATVRKKISSLSKLFKWVSLSGVCPMQNPFDGLNGLAKGGKEAGGTADKRAFSMDELKAIFQYIRDNKKGDELRLQEDALLLLALTGVRFKPILSLTKDQVSKDGETYWIDIQEDKSASGKRIVPIVSKSAIAILERRLEEDGDSIFPEYAKSIKDQPRSDALGKRMRSSIKNALPKARGKVDIHSFRRSFITIGDEQVEEVNDLARLVGHKLPSFTLRQYSSSKGKKKIERAARLICAELEKWIS